MDAVEPRSADEVSPPVSLPAAPCAGGGGPEVRTDDPAPPACRGAGADAAERDDRDDAPDEADVAADNADAEHGSSRRADGLEGDPSPEAGALEASPGQAAAGACAERLDEVLGPSLIDHPEARSEELAVSRWRTEGPAELACQQEDEVLLHVAFQPLEAEREREGEVRRGQFEPGHVSVVTPGPEVWRLPAPESGAADFAQLAVTEEALHAFLVEQGAEPRPIRSVFCARAPELERVAYRALQAVEGDEFHPEEHAQELMGQLTHHLGGLERVPAGARLSPAQLRRVRELVHDRLRERIDLAELAACVGLSRFHFLRAFRNTTGITPGDYLFRTRVARAQRLIAETEQSLARIACLTGFADQGHLTRQFRRRLGVTPSGYRGLVRGPRARVGHGRV